MYGWAGRFPSQVEVPGVHCDVVARPRTGVLGLYNPPEPTAQGPQEGYPRSRGRSPTPEPWRDEVARQCPVGWGSNDEFEDLEWEAASSEVSSSSLQSLPDLIPVQRSEEELPPPPPIPQGSFWDAYTTDTVQACTQFEAAVDAVAFSWADWREGM